MSRSSSRLFSLSDYSSHPYSIYYGTSGSTAQQNFGQNDDINDVYGYGPDERFRPDRQPYDERENIHLNSLQDIPLLHDRRGATVFGTRHNDPNPNNFYEDERERMFLEDRRMMDEMDSLVHERDDLRRQLDSVVGENVHLQNQHYDANAGPQVVPPPPPPPPRQDSYYPETNYAPSPSGSMPMGQDQSTRHYDSVMDQLKNMQRTAQAFETGHHQPNISPAMNSVAPSAESMNSQWQNPVQYQPPSSEFGTSAHGFDDSTGEASQPPSINGSALEERPNLDQTTEGPKAESRVSGEGDFQGFGGEYELMIKAELKKKTSTEGTDDLVEKEIDVNKKSNQESSSKEETFGSKYL
jgi:hypothetical protein